MRGRQACLLLSGILALPCFAGMTGAGSQVSVEAQGHLWAHTGERGFFKTTDGGKTLEPGIYLVKLTVEEKNYQGLVAVREDPSLNRK